MSAIPQIDNNKRETIERKTMPYQGTTILTYEDYWRVCQKRRRAGKPDPERRITVKCGFCDKGVKCKDPSHLPITQVRLVY